MFSYQCVFLSIWFRIYCHVCRKNWTILGDDGLVRIFVAVTISWSGCLVHIMWLISISVMMTLITLEQWSKCMCNSTRRHCRSEYMQSRISPGCEPRPPPASIYQHTRTQHGGSIIANWIARVWLWQLFKHNVNSIMTLWDIRHHCAW